MNRTSLPHPPQYVTWTLTLASDMVLDLRTAASKGHGKRWLRHSKFAWRKQDTAKLPTTHQRMRFSYCCLFASRARARVCVCARGRDKQGGRQQTNLMKQKMRRRDEKTELFAHWFFFHPPSLSWAVNRLAWLAHRIAGDVFLRRQEERFFTCSHRC
jgi:hypothetical protein